MSKYVYTVFSRLKKDELGAEKDFEVAFGQTSKFVKCNEEEKLGKLNVVYGNAIYKKNCLL